jgi:hypothetical protein
MRFQYLKHSLQERMVYHSNQLREAIIKLWQRGYSYSSIVDTINGSAIAQISKGTVAYQVKKFQETNSVKTMKKTGRPRSVRTPNLRRSTKAKIVRNQKDNFQRFWPKSFWPPSSPDLNVMDFAIWGILARKACEKPLANVASLKRSLKKAWADLDEETIRNCCANAHKRLEAVVEAEGGYIEKK